MTNTTWETIKDMILEELHIDAQEKERQIGLLSGKIFRLLSLFHRLCGMEYEQDEYGNYISDETYVNAVLEDINNELYPRHEPGEDDG